MVQTSLELKKTAVGPLEESCVPSGTTMEPPATIWNVGEGTATLVEAVVVVLVVGGVPPPGQETLSVSGEKMVLSWTAYSLIGSKRRSEANNVFPPHSRFSTEVAKLTEAEQSG